MSDAIHGCDPEKPAISSSNRTSIGMRVSWLGPNLFAGTEPGCVLAQHVSVCLSAVVTAAPQAVLLPYFLFMHISAVWCRLELKRWKICCIPMEPVSVVGHPRSPASVFVMGSCCTAPVSLGCTLLSLGLGAFPACISAFPLRVNFLFLVPLL